jgi:hypothetical protein
MLCRSMATSRLRQDEAMAPSFKMPEVWTMPNATVVSYCSHAVVAILVCVAALCGHAMAAETAAGKAAAPSPYAAWKNGPPKDPNYFPLAVWLQDPRNAAKYKAAGINVYIGLWKGPTERQLAALKSAGMPVICAQNDVGLRHRDDPTIIGWMHGDEPDNAQARKDGKGYGPPIKPEKIIADYRKIKAADATRPVILNLGQGVAWDGWVGRGVRTNHPEDYVEYVKGCDVASFDIYPAVSTRPQTAGKLHLVGQGTRRLWLWSGGKRIVWNCIEASRISNPTVKPTPAQIRSEVWMSIIHGSTGLIYFVHQFKPRFVEASLLQDKELLAAVTKINRQVRELAPVINSRTVIRAFTSEPEVFKGLPTDQQSAIAPKLALAAAGWLSISATTSPPKVPIHLMAKAHGGATYIFAVGMSNAEATVTFRRSGRYQAREEPPVEVVGEGRKLKRVNGEFTDTFKPYDVHIYKIP